MFIDLVWIEFNESLFPSFYSQQFLFLFLIQVDGKSVAGKKHVQQQFLYDSKSKVNMVLGKCALVQRGNSNRFLG